MKEPRNSGDALSGVVMGKTAGAALVGEGAIKSEPSIAVEIDGGALVARVLQSQGVKYLFAVNGGHTWPLPAAPRNQGHQLIHLRHHPSKAYAARGRARTPRTPAHSHR